VFYHCIFDTMIHTTIGLYPNGDTKINGVDSAHLEGHIEYNKQFRFGRALFVDGKLVYKGLVPKDVIEKFEKSETIKTVLKKSTAPYK